VRRRLFNFAAAVSLVLCVAACVLWVRSYWRQNFSRSFGRAGRPLRADKGSGFKFTASFGNAPHPSEIRGILR